MKCPLIIKEAMNPRTFGSKKYELIGNSLRSNIVEARKNTNTSPSEAQIKAENYKKGTFRWNGLTIKIENPKGSTRSGTSLDGKKWSIKMKFDYGYLAGEQKGRDGDAVDIFIGDHPESQIVYVIDQMFKGKFDEHKCVLGALTEEEARKTYLANYEKGWSGLGKIKALTVEQFKEWVKDGNTRKAINKQKLFKVGGNMKCPEIIKTAKKSKYPVSFRESFIAGLDPTGAKTFQLSQRSKRHKKHKAVGLGGGLIGGTVIVPSVVSGLIGAGKGFALGKSLPGRVIGGIRGLGKGAVLPYRTLYHGVKGTKALGVAKRTGVLTRRGATHVHKAMGLETGAKAIKGKSFKNMMPLLNKSKGMSEIHRIVKDKTINAISGLGASALVGGSSSMIQYNLGRGVGDERRKLKKLTKKGEHYAKC